ncbi:MAG: polysaccharide pyruvyl transferase family protein [Myxococcaceae bacterium]|nr:polysaccharide pyruvyl transferase family protein [Myxococcaceae bacterium]
MRFSFFAAPSTLEKHYSQDSAKVLLAGGFNGNWNFGDILQLQGCIRWHRARQEHAVVTPLHELSRFRDASYLQHLRGVFGVEDFLFYTSEPTAASVQQARDLGLVPVVPRSLKGQSTLHVYGGGYFNRFWGHYMVGVVEAVLRAWLPGHYVVSGQQISPDFAADFAAHAQQWQPAVVGCRDPLSAKALAECGLEARLSGDDALEELVRAAELAARGGPRKAEKGRFALHMNLSTYTHAKPAGQAEPTRKAEDLMNEQLRQLREHLGENAKPVVLNAFIDERAVVEDSLSCVRKTDFPVLFPRAEFVDLVGLLLQDRLSQAFERVRQCELLVTSSYHVTLLSKVAGVPAFLAAYNDYYLQKKGGLADAAGSLPQFLASDWGKVEAEGTAYVERQRELRREWLESLGDVLGRPTSDVTWVARAAHWVEDARGELEQYRQQREQEAQAARTTAEEAERQHAAKLEQERARIAELERERQALRARCDTQEAELQLQAARNAELQARYAALLEQEPPLRHRLVDGLNERLKKAGGARAHDTFKRVLDATVRRRK